MFGKYWCIKHQYLPNICQYMSVYYSTYYTHLHALSFDKCLAKCRCNSTVAEWSHIFTIFFTQAIYTFFLVMG